MPQQTPRVELLLIDPQVSFCDPQEGELYVPGAEHDMERLAALINRAQEPTAAIHVTLDTHQELDVGHPVFWVNQQGQHPEPFTFISRQEVLDGVWQPYAPDQPSPPFDTLRERMIDYVTRLEQGGRYQVTIWPPHCRIGTPGHTIAAPLREALQQWELNRYTRVHYVLKGSNMFTEHYSAVQAEVPDPQDAETEVNTRLLQTLEQADRLLLAGEASSHCVANTIRDMFRYVKAEVAQKCVLLTDAMSPVPGFEQVAEEFLQEMTDRGMQTTTTTECFPDRK
jgi:nicotinamidase/pyrazinamidase